MKILHLTDLHFTNVIGNRTKQQKLIQNLVIDLQENISQVDFVIFSGDIVNNGSSLKDFEIVQEEFLEKVLQILQVPKSNFFICPGNHDVDRSLVSNSLVKYLDESIKTNDDLDNFFRSPNPDLETSHIPLKNYRKFLKDFYGQEIVKSDVSYPMYSVHIRKCGPDTIGFVTLNTAWRAIGKDDDNKLLFPIRKVDEALDRILNCNVKILIHHHPLSTLKPYNAYHLEDLIHKRFDFVFSGHVHKNSLSLDLTPNEGVVKLGSSANLSFELDSQIGYSFIDINNDFLEFTVNFRMYDLNYETFYPLSNKTYSIPSSSEKIEQNKLRINIRKRFVEELEDSKGLFVENNRGAESKNLLELSTIPVLKEKSLSEIFNEEDKSCPDFAWNNFFQFNSDYIIYGRDKCGKTILLKKIELELLKDFSTHRSLPFYIDLKEWNAQIKPFDFQKEFSKYYFLNTKSGEELTNERKIILLIDNFQYDNPTLKDKLEEIVSSHENFRLIICSARNSVNTLEENRFDGRSLEKLYFHRLRKMHIKELTKKSYNLSEEKEEQIVEKIETIFKKLSIPFNYWTISIFLWVFNKDGKNNLHSDVDLINLYIEKLIEKDQLTLRAAMFTFNDYKKLLAHLAHFLLTENHKTSYYAKYSDIINFIEDHVDKNPRRRTDPREIFEYLDDRGILRKKDEDLYSFRLKGVFEYFVAYYMTFDEVFLKKSVEDEGFYLSFVNEFELYAGFRRDNLAFLKVIYEKTQYNFLELNELYNLEESSIDKILVSKVIEADGLGNLIEKFSKKFKNGLSEGEQDQMEEELIKEIKFDESQSEVKRKKIKVINNTAESLEESLKILGRVYRNIDDINDVHLVYEIFDYVIENACLWSFRLLDEFGDLDISNIVKTDKDGEAKHLIKIISNVIPTLVQVRLYDMLGHVNLEGIILDRLKDAKNKYRDNQFKLFIYCFLLCDINYKQHQSIIKDIIPLIRIPIIKYSFILKMNYYLGFKSNLKPKDKQYLKNCIQNQYLKFNSTVDVGSVQKGLAKK
jgi:predicted MPP superfamily phosphohydrolase